MFKCKYLNEIIKTEIKDKSLSISAIDEKISFNSYDTANIIFLIINFEVIKKSTIKNVIVKKNILTTRTWYNKSCNISFIFSNKQ